MGKYKFRNTTVDSAIDINLVKVRRLFKLHKLGISINNPLMSDTFDEIDKIFKDCRLKIWKDRDLKWINEKDEIVFDMVYFQRKFIFYPSSDTHKIIEFKNNDTPGTYFMLRAILIVLTEHHGLDFEYLLLR